MDTPSFLTDSWDDVERFFGIGGKTTANLNPSMTPGQVKTATSAATMQNVGLLTTIMGGVSSAIGGYFSAKSTQYQERSQALNMQYQSDMAAINARSAEYSAQSELEAGKSQVFNLTMQAGQQKESTTASMAARGIALGSATAQEISASQDIVKDVNMYTISANATRAAAQARTQGTNYANQALMDRTSAVNANMSASSISPFAAMNSSLLTTASSVAQQWNNSMRLKMMYANGYYGG
jgi:hypothetical protein